MYIPQLDTFLKVAESGSFSKAAQALYITPSAVIQQINHLETNLEVHLCVRTARGVQLTDAGELLQREGTSLLAQWGKIRAMLQSMQLSSSSTLCIGMALLRKCPLFQWLWPAFHLSHPQTQARFVEINYPLTQTPEVELFESVWDGTTPTKEWDFLPVGQVPLFCALPTGHPLAHMCELTYEDMQPYTIVTICADGVPALATFCEDIHAHGLSVIEVPQYDVSVFGMCEANHYLLQMPACWKNLYPELIMIPCVWSHTLTYGFFFRKKQLSETASAFLAYARENAAEAIRKMNWQRPAAGNQS